MMEQSLLLTKREIEAVNKKLQHKSLSQQDSNCLSRFVRPKLREMSRIDSTLLLKQLEYNQKIRHIEAKIKDIILKNVPDVSSITLYGSLIYSNYTNYNDIDVLVSVRKIYWKDYWEKYHLISKIKKLSKKKRLKLDIKIFSEDAIQNAYAKTPVLIYELEDSRTIYGRLEVSKEVRIDNLSLRMQLDYSDSILWDIDEYGIKDIEPRSLYSAIRNVWTVRLIMQKVVDNNLLIEILNQELGKNLIHFLKTNKASLTQKRIAALYLKELNKKTRKSAEEAKEGIIWVKEA